MFTRPIKEVVEFLEKRALKFGIGCEKVFVAISGGVDSAVVVTILCRAFGSKNVVGLYRDIKSNPQHLEDTRGLRKIWDLLLKFPMIVISRREPLTGM